jgi:NAD(P)-dependent dehydrogenase (short-subunit alcohol dehydrogenase family)
VMLCRDKARGEFARNDIVSRTGSHSVNMMVGDLSSMESTRGVGAEFDSRYSRLDVLVNNAAIYSNTRVVTPEGFELMFATNYLGPFLLTRLLIPRLEASKPSWIINVTAPSTTKPELDNLQGERKFGALGAFGASKAADLLFTYSLARRLEGRGVAVYAYHPGIVRTNLMRKSPAPIRAITAAMNLFVGHTPEKASVGVIELSTMGESKFPSGQLIHEGKVISAPMVDDKDLQDRLWKASCELVGLSEQV